ncbi:hypothetical protein D3C80_1870740 [compost metagenome]
MGHGFGQGIELEVIELLAGDDRDRLRGFLDRQVQARGRTHAAGGVGATVLRGAAQSLGDNFGGTEFQHTLF